MGTNFYTLKKEHIGKRSAAGLFCWDCMITLCKNGNEGIHYGCKEHRSALCNCGWYDKCPKCGKEKEIESLESSSMGTELGFNKEEPKKKTGVKTCSSFSWAIDPNKFKELKIKFIIDEYEERFTKQEFEKMLEEWCPVHYTRSVGKEFS